MIYRITFMSDEVDNFKRVFEIDADATFLDLHKAIINAVNYPDDQMTSFFLCNDDWEKEQEITLVEMPSSPEYDNYVMESTTLSELITELHQKLYYIFDQMYERGFFGELTSIKAGKLKEPQCVVSEGKAPKQLQEVDPLTAPAKGGKDIDLDEDFFGDSEFDDDELDADGFGDMNFDDNSLF